jgi:hypothetical protein
MIALALTVQVVVAVVIVFIPGVADYSNCRYLKAWFGKRKKNHKIWTTEAYQSLL